MIGCRNESLFVRAEPNIGEYVTDALVVTSYPLYPFDASLPKYSGSRGSLSATMMLAKRAPATRSLPKDDFWNCAHMLRSDVAPVWYVLKSFAELEMPAVASVSTVLYSVLPLRSTRRRWMRALSMWAAWIHFVALPA